MLDVVIVGAGPAGLGCAIALAQRGFQVQVCEIDPLPRDKACGEGILPSGVQDLRRLGVLSQIAPERAAWFHGVRYHSPRGVVAEARFAEGLGLALRRTELSRALVARADELRIPIVQTRVSGLRPSERQISVLTQRGEISARLVIGADGLNSQIRRWAGLERPTRRARERYGLRRHYAVQPWSKMVEVYWAYGAEAYVTPLSDSVGVAVLVHRAARAAPLSFTQLMSAFPALQQRLRGADVIGKERGAGPFLRVVRRSYEPGVLLVGDAAGYIDALTGEGISLALAHALLVGEHLALPLTRARREGRIVCADALIPLAKAARERTRGYRQLTRLLLLMGSAPALVDRMTLALRENPAAFSHFLSANMGTVPLWRWPLPGWLALARSVVWGAYNTRSLASCQQPQTAVLPKYDPGEVHESFSR